MSYLTDIFLGIVLIAFAVMVATHMKRTKRLAQESRERKLMVALVSHRLRTPLSSVKWHTEMLLSEEFGKLQIAQMELLDKVNTGIGDAISVLNRFLEASRIEQGELACKPVMIDVWEQIDHVCSSLTPTIRSKNIQVEARKSSERILAFCDPLVLHSVLDVLLLNAVTYTPEKGTLHIGTKDGSTEIQIFITDNGIGIPAQEQKHVFEKFFRSKAALTVATNGNGLGLYLVKQMLGSIGGSISFVSEEGKGTTFTVTLPKARTE